MMYIKVLKLLSYEYKIKDLTILTWRVTLSAYWEESAEVRGG